jgi:hypothetical protein
MKKLSVCVAAMVFPAVAAAQACAPNLKGAQQFQSDRYVVAYRTLPEKVAVGRHFGVDFAVCPKPGQPAPEAVKIDAYMPEHRHGMNYQAVVKPAPAPGQYHAEGLMFHMPGRWEYIFEIRGGGTVDRITRPITLE